MHSKHKNILPAIFLSLLIQLLLLSMVRSQSLGDYRSKQNGIWQDILVWEIYDSGSWTAAVYPPNQHSGNIEIIHQINITADQVLDQVNIVPSGSLSINPGVMVTAINSANVFEIVLKGTLLNQGMLFFSPSSKMRIDSGGTYIHNSSVSSSVLLDACSIDSLSTFIYRGNGTLAPPVSLSNRTYGHLVFESTAGNWSRTITGTNPTSCTSLNIHSNVMLINNLSNSMTIRGDMILNGSLVNGSGIQKIILAGLAGNIQGSSLNNFCDTLVIQTGSNYTQLNNILTSPGATVNISGTLDFQNNYINANNNGSNFILNAGATLVTANELGIKGSVKGFGNMNFSSEANYVYTGSLLQSSGLYNDTVGNLTINKTNDHVLLDKDIHIEATMFLQKGKLITGSHTLFSNDPLNNGIIGASDSSFISGNLCLKIPQADSINVHFPIGENYYNPVSFLNLKNTDTTLFSVFMKEIIPNGSADIVSLTETMTDRFWNMKVIGDNHISDLGTIKLRPYSPIPVLSDSSAIGVSLNDSAFSYHGIGGEVDSLGICASAPLNLCQLSSLTAIQGLFIGIAKKKDNEGVYTDASCSSLLLIKVFLQAYYNSNGSMNACLGSMYPNICDTVLVELHEIDPPYAAVYSSKEILGTDGMLEVLLPSTLNQSYYIILKHRNSLETWSSTPVAINDTLIFYDFSMDASKALGDNQIELSTGIYAIYSGDIINSIVGSNPYQDGIINQADLSKLEEDLISFKTGYQTSDLNGDQIVDQSDYSLLENNLNLGIQVIRP